MKRLGIHIVGEYLIPQLKILNFKAVNWLNCGYITYYILQSMISLVNLFTPKGLFCIKGKIGQQKLIDLTIGF